MPLLCAGAENMNPLDDAKPDYSSLERPKQPVLSVGEWMSIMQALKGQIGRFEGVLDCSSDNEVKEFIKEDIRITKALLKKLKEAGFSES